MSVITRDDSDFYLNTTTDELIGPKTNGSWSDPGVKTISFAGPNGADGTTGPAGANGISNVFIFTTDPTVNDDSTFGYVIGSRWINSVSNNEYICVDATSGSAIWCDYW